jgi:hypothetical protein
MAHPRYYALVASLPRLPHFDQAEWVPITLEELDSRLGALTPDHRTQLNAATSLIRWQRQPGERTTTDIIDQYRSAMQVIDFKPLLDFVNMRMGQRSVVVALRMKQLGRTPEVDKPWGVGPLTARIQIHWDQPDLGLGAVFPWIDQAQALLAKPDAIALERLLMDAAWQRLTAIEALAPFGFERVIAFVFKWYMVKRRLSYDADASKDRFQELISEVTRDHQNIFA